MVTYTSRDKSQIQIKASVWAISILVGHNKEIERTDFSFPLKNVVLTMAVRERGRA